MLRSSNSRKSAFNWAPGFRTCPNNCICILCRRKRKEEENEKSTGRTTEERER